MQNNKSGMFSGLIGQSKAKRRLGFYLKGFNATGICPHVMFIAPKGCGKTMMAKAMGKLLMSDEIPEKPKPFLEINCSTLKNVKQLVNQILIPHVAHKEVTILFDECSELPRDITMALLTMLNPNPENKTSFSYDDYVIDFDFSRHTFMFATTEAQSVFHALMDRCERVDLEEYSFNELGKIVKLTLPSVDFEEGLLDDIATVLRGNARAAQKMANNMAIYLKAEGRKNFTKEDWKEIQYELGIAPLGLSPIEIQILGELGKVKDCSLTHLAAKTGLTKACVQRDFEMYLQKMDLMQITTAGRAITKKGKDYLEELWDCGGSPVLGVQPVVDEKGKPFSTLTEEQAEIATNKPKVIKLNIPKKSILKPVNKEIEVTSLPDGFLPNINNK
jgi:Holliday junction resolvasome RuvABC ATP-dependent DNA helicase subunit